jgi:hypothetical protein
MIRKGCFLRGNKWDLTGQGYGQTIKFLQVVTFPLPKSLSSQNYFLFLKLVTHPSQHLIMLVSIYVGTMSSLKK